LSQKISYLTCNLLKIRFSDSHCHPFIRSIGIYQEGKFCTVVFEKQGFLRRSCSRRMRKKLFAMFRLFD